MSRKLNYLFLIPAFALSLNLSGQRIDSTSFKMNPRLSFYSFENSGEMLIHIPQGLIWNNLNITLKISDKEIISWKGIPGKRILAVPFDLGINPSTYKVVAEIKSSDGYLYKATSGLQILDSKPNEVKTDKLTGGLIVGGRILFPFGFYSYSPVYSTLPEEEVVKGFNMISPYQKILPETFRERKAYMDRCAELGMKVHYNLLSVSGGGGVSSKIEGISES